MLFSVVVCTYNREQSIIPCLNSIDKSILNYRDGEYIDGELIIVDNNSGDSTFEYVEEWAKERKYPVHVLLETQKGLAAARNTGLKNASGDLLIFTDDDIEMPSQDYPYDLSQDDLSKWSSQDQENINIVLDEDKNLETSDLESEIKQSLKKRFELRKRTESSNDFQDIANYIDTEVASDYVYDQNDF